MKPVTTLAIALAFACLAQTASAATITFKSSSTYAGKQVQLTGDLRTPGRGKAPLAILLHGCGGLQPAVAKSLRSHASALRSAGFATLILDSFTPRGISGGWVCARDSRLASAQAYRQRDVKDAVAYLASNEKIDRSKVFVVGQSNGGSVSSLLANRPFKGLRGAVAFYPWCGAVPRSPRVPLLVLSGEADDWTPPKVCKSRDKPGGNLTVVTYPNAVHSFDLNIPVQTFLGHKVGGNSKARSDARRRMVSLAKQVVH